MRYVRILIVTLILAAIGSFVWITAGSNPEEMLLEGLSQAQQNPVLTTLLLSAFVLLGTLTGLPVMYINMAMGFTLSFVPAIIFSWGANLLSVMLSFFMVRFLFSAYFHEKYGEKKLIRRINKRIKKYGIWTVAFSRAIYIIPTNVINFSFPLSKISPRSYLLGTALGLVPECLIGVLSGYLIKHGIDLLASSESLPWTQIIIGAAILILAILGIILLNRMRRRKKFRRLI